MQKQAKVYPVIKSIAIGALLVLSVQGTAHAEIASLPKLNIVTDCGECAVGDNVKADIEKAYAEQAQKAGLPINTEETAQFRITEYAERSGSARILFGRMAGKDRIKANLNYKDVQHEVEDTARSAMNGIGAVAAEVGKQTYAKLSGKPVIYEQAQEQ